MARMNDGESFHVPDVQEAATSEPCELGCDFDGCKKMDQLEAEVARLKAELAIAIDANKSFTEHPNWITPEMIVFEMPNEPNRQAKVGEFWLGNDGGIRLGPTDGKWPVLRRRAYVEPSK